MSKYSTFDFNRYPDAYMHLANYEGFAMYEAVRLGRYVLVKDDKEVAFKNKADFPPSIDKWVEDWRKNARKQLDKLEGRIDILLSEQNEIINLLED